MNVSAHSSDTPSKEERARACVRDCEGWRKVSENVAEHTRVSDESAVSDEVNVSTAVTEGDPLGQIPAVSPEWVSGCVRERRAASTRHFQLAGGRE